MSFTSKVTLRCPHCSNNQLVNFENVDVGAERRRSAMTQCTICDGWMKAHLNITAHAWAWRLPLGEEEKEAEAWAAAHGTWFPLHAPSLRGPREMDRGRDGAARSEQGDHHPGTTTSRSL